MLGKVCTRFVEKRAISVMVCGTLERVVGADRLQANVRCCPSHNAPRVLPLAPCQPLDAPFEPDPRLLCVHFPPHEVFAVVNHFVCG